MRRRKLNQCSLVHTMQPKVMKKLKFTCALSAHRQGPRAPLLPHSGARLRRQRWRRSHRRALSFTRPRRRLTTGLLLGQDGCGEPRSHASLRKLHAWCLARCDGRPPGGIDHGGVSACHHADDMPCHVRHEDTDKIRKSYRVTKGMFSIGKPRRLNVAACGFLLRITSRAVR